MYMPAERLGKAYNFEIPFKRPYRILTMFDNGAEVKLIERPQADAIRVALNHVRRCPCEISSSNGPDAGEENNDREESEPVSPGLTQPEPVTGEPVLAIEPTSPLSLSDKSTGREAVTSSSPMSTQLPTSRPTPAMLNSWNSHLRHPRR